MLLLLVIFNDRSNSSKHEQLLKMQYIYYLENSSSQTDSSIATEIDAANGDDHDHSLSTTEQVISRSRSTESSEESIESSTNR